MRLLVESLAQIDPVNKPITAAELSGRWELVYSTVELFRASPFFQMASKGGLGGRPLCADGFRFWLHMLTMNPGLSHQRTHPH